MLPPTVTSKVTCALAPRAGLVERPSPTAPGRPETHNQGRDLGDARTGNRDRVSWANCQPHDAAVAESKPHPAVGVFGEGISTSG
jgi:hypothetical protein